eukprot:PhM_4_TR16101/c1_g1_i1/m.77584
MLDPRSPLGPAALDGAGPEAFRVFNGLMTTMYKIPCTNVNPTSGSENYLRHERLPNWKKKQHADEYNDGKPVVFFLCDNYVLRKGECPHGAQCTRIHADLTLPGTETTDIHSKFYLSHRTLPPGSVIPVHDRATNNVAMHTSDSVLVTKGSDDWYRMPEDERRRIYHCRHYHEEGFCIRGENCVFLHVMPRRATTAPNTPAIVPDYRKQLGSAMLAPTTSAFPDDDDDDNQMSSSPPQPVLMRTPKSPCVPSQQPVSPLLATTNTTTASSFGVFSSPPMMGTPTTPTPGGVMDGRRPSRLKAAQALLNPLPLSPKDDLTGTTTTTTTTSTTAGSLSLPRAGGSGTPLGSPVIATYQNNPYEAVVLVGDVPKRSVPPPPMNVRVSPGGGHPQQPMPYQLSPSSNRSLPSPAQQQQQQQRASSTSPSMTPSTPLTCPPAIT